MSIRPLALIAAGSLGLAVCAGLPAAASAVPSASAAAAASTAAAGAAPASITAAGPALPSSDPFYTYRGSAPLAGIAAGTVLDKRAVTISLNVATTPQASLGVPGAAPVQLLPAEQLLYRTADELGQPSVTVTTVVVPAAAAVAPKLVAYLSFYDSLSTKCDPSYTLQGGNPDSNNTELTDLEQGLVAQYYALGYVTTIPDFEGTGLHWTAGHEAGYGTLDAIKATEAYLNAPASTPVGLSGYSGGSIAADWASELAPTYAPAVKLVGVAEGGIPVDFAHNLTYVDGSAVWSGILPAVLDALSRAYGIDLPTYLSPYGLQLAGTDGSECIGDFSGSTPGLVIAKLLKPQYQNFLQQPVFVNILNSLIMGTVPGHPAGPLFMAVGNDPNNAQGQGDDIMVTDDVIALAHEYCSQGVSVQYSQYNNSTHEQAALEFEPAATAFLTQRFAGATPATNDCSSIGVGNSLAPIALTPASSSAATQTSTSTATTASAAKKSPVAKKSSVKARTATRKRGPAAVAATATVTQPSQTLAYTGADPLLAVLALALLGGAVGARRLRSRS